MLMYSFYVSTSAASSTVERSLDDYYIGLSNAIAGGMMLAASYSLVTEGSNVDEGI